ncbi:TMEM43 family protein, partial [Patescibacteria group bacterium]|nr:TMEM43 family protein [Patescibacteria group bacterium]
TAGRVDYSIVSQTAVAPENVTETKDFVYVTDKLIAPEKMGDGLYLESGDYVAINRKAEMYAWVEDSSVENEKTYYKYDTAWVENPSDSAEFDQTKYHENPSMDIDGLSEVAKNVRLGEYTIDLESVRLPGFDVLDLKEDMVKLDRFSTLESNEGVDYIYIGRGSWGEPVVGDIRISYSVIPSGKKVTVFGMIEDEEIVQHYDHEKQELFRIFLGVKQNAAATLSGEYGAAGWMGRILGFLVMWIGLMMTLKPLSVSFELIPFVGDIGKKALGIVTFVIALLITIISYLIMAILHSVLGLVLVALAAIAIVGYLYMNRRAVKK